LVVFRATRPSPSSEMEIDGTTLNHPWLTCWSCVHQI
jgi:hypothetical protein